jgi:hypothetical protein
VSRAGNPGQPVGLDFGLSLAMVRQPFLTLSH